MKSLTSVGRPAASSASTEPGDRDESEGAEGCAFATAGAPTIAAESASTASAARNGRIVSIVASIVAAVAPRGADFDAR